MVRHLLIVGILFALVANTGLSQEGKKEETFTDKITDAKQCCACAAHLNFSKSLGVPLDYLGSIGHRIYQARRAPDPVELALAGKALQVAEQVSGKTAAVTSADVLKDAVNIAKMRGISTEIKAVALIVTDDATQKDLAKEGTLATKREEEAAAKLKSGESTRELFGTLTVANHSNECIRIYVSGRYVGEVHRGQTRGFHVHDHNHYTQLEAFCEEGGHLVSRRSVHHSHGYYWHIH